MRIVRRDRSETEEGGEVKQAKQKKEAREKQKKEAEVKQKKETEAEANQATRK